MKRKKNCFSFLIVFVLSFSIAFSSVFLGEFSAQAGIFDNIGKLMKDTVRKTSKTANSYKKSAKAKKTYKQAKKEAKKVLKKDDDDEKKYSLKHSGSDPAYVNDKIKFTLNHAKHSSKYPVSFSATNGDITSKSGNHCYVRATKKGKLKVYAYYKGYTYSKSVKIKERKKKDSVTDSSGKTPYLNKTSVTMSHINGGSFSLEVKNYDGKVKWYLTGQDITMEAGFGMFKKVSKKSLGTSNPITIKVNSLGKATVIAKIKGKTLTCHVNSKVGLQKKTEVNVKRESNLVVGETITCGTTNDPSKFEWSSENTKIATVNQKGVVKGKKAGTTTIKAKYKKGNTVYVYKVHVVDSQMNYAYKIYFGKSKTVAVSKKVYWSSTSPKKLKITSPKSGKASAKVTVKAAKNKDIVYIYGSDKNNNHIYKLKFKIVKNKSDKDSSGDGSDSGSGDGVNVNNSSGSGPGSGPGSSPGTSSSNSPGIGSNPTNQSQANEGKKKIIQKIYHTEKLTMKSTQVSRPGRIDLKNVPNSEGTVWYYYGNDSHLNSIDPYSNYLDLFINGNVGTTAMIAERTVKTTKDKIYVEQYPIKIIINQ